ncbi:Uma2 family endonuclease [Synechococcales cyanobacterium C]|uniref:Uma2 family endonuclease n=1 Tax=Petrachloros mirabilis ULC683 TaxID=2781853 RepID=A0A8K2A867_9CYAN|nr:Uma2 family endonuclease [Petrachloros mirabilis]NCJ06909.1 Uma2 family endonuclease [Petrachloros mirabilis ULC683]
MGQAATGQVRWTIADVDLLTTDEWKRYEIIDGELFVTRAPHWKHQITLDNICAELQVWSQATGQGRAVSTPGIIFTETNSVIPDVVWVSRDRLSILLDEAGHLTGAPELVVEVLSPGVTNERRDKEAKLKLYSIQGVQEYWIVNWQLQQVEVYRRDNTQLAQVATLLTENTLTSPLLPEFCCLIERFFA